MGKVADRRYSFAGGLNSAENPSSLRNDELSAVRNYGFDTTGALVTRGGQARVTTVPASARQVTSLYQYYKRSGSSFTIFFRNQTMFQKSGTDGASIDATTFTQDSTFTFATFNDTLYYTNGVDTVSSENIRKWTGSGSASAPSDSPTNPCRYLIASTKMQRLLAAGDDTDPDTVYATALGNGEDWTTANDAFSIKVRTFKGDKIMGLAEINAGILVLKQSSIHLITGSDPTNITVVPLSLDTGCTSARSVAATQTTAYWLYNNQVFQTDGARVFPPVSSRIMPTIAGMTSLANSIGNIYKNRSYRLYCTPSGGTTNTRCLEYYFNQPTSDGRRPWTQHDSVSVSSVATLVGGELYTGDYAGFINQQESGTTDFGTNITAYADTPWNFLGEPERFKKFKRIWVMAEPTGNYNLSVYLSYDGNDNTTVPETISLNPLGAIWGSFLWGAATWGGASTFQESAIRISATAQSIKLRFQSTSPTKIYGYTMVNRRKRIK